MKVLFIGGTGNISAAVSRLAVSKGIDLYLLNSGKRKIAIDGARTINGDVSQPAELAKRMQGEEWDVVVNWIAYNAADVERDMALFHGRTRLF